MKVTEIAKYGSPSWEMYANETGTDPLATARRIRSEAAAPKSSPFPIRPLSCWRKSWTFFLKVNLFSPAYEKKAGEVSTPRTLVTGFYMMRRIIPVMIRGFHMTSAATFDPSYLN